MQARLRVPPAKTHLDNAFKKLTRTSCHKLPGNLGGIKDVGLESLTVQVDESRPHFLLIQCVSTL